MAKKAEETKRDIKKAKNAAAAGAQATAKLNIAKLQRKEINYKTSLDQRSKGRSQAEKKLLKKADRKKSGVPKKDEVGKTRLKKAMVKAKAKTEGKHIKKQLKK